MSLKIVGTNGSTMLEEQLAVHKVYNPFMWVFTSAPDTKNWPQTLEHFGVEYTFKYDALLPSSALKKQYTGYATYCIENYENFPVTHRDVGAYLVALGYSILKNDLSLGEAQAPTARKAENDLEEAVVEAIPGCTKLRAKTIIDECLRRMAATDFNTISTSDPEALQKRLQEKE